MATLFSRIDLLSLWNSFLCMIMLIGS
jgi:hypothetical protein